jgi:hypothetical protein
MPFFFLSEISHNSFYEKYKAFREKKVSFYEIVK